MYQAPAQPLDAQCYEYDVLNGQAPVQEGGATTKVRGVIACARFTNAYNAVGECRIREAGVEEALPA